LGFNYWIPRPCSRHTIATLVMQQKVRFTKYNVFLPT
jgi:hypothetical protein